MEPSLVLSLFPGADLLGRGFERAGFCVVRGPDAITGGDIREFKPLADTFGGIIGGSPCGDFSAARRAPPSGHGVAMIAEYVRCVVAARVPWFLHENVPNVPDVVVPGYHVQRFNASPAEWGGKQNRLRCFQFGSLDGVPLVIPRGSRSVGSEPCCLATDGKSSRRRSWREFVQLQGLPADFDLPGWSLEAKYRAVGNGVHVFVAEHIANAIAQRERWHLMGQTPCACGCGRPVVPPRTRATVACRKRISRRRSCMSSGPTD